MQIQASEFPLQYATDTSQEGFFKLKKKKNHSSSFQNSALSR